LEARPNQLGPVEGLAMGELLKVVHGGGSGMIPRFIVSVVFQLSVRSLA
jgi:hypothetical protein